jgi:hypothetical protein
LIPRRSEASARLQAVTLACGQAKLRFAGCKLATSRSVLRTVRQLFQSLALVKERKEKAKAFPVQNGRPALFAMDELNVPMHGFHESRLHQSSSLTVFK